MHFIIAKFLAEVGILFVETDPETGKTQPVILSLFREMRCYLWNVSWFLAKKPKRNYYYTANILLVKKHNFSLCNISRALPVPFGHLITTARMFCLGLIWYYWILFLVLRKYLQYLLLSVKIILNSRVRNRRSNLNNRSPCKMWIK